MNKKILVNDHISMLYQQRYYLERYIYIITYMNGIDTNSKMAGLYGMCLDLQLYNTWNNLIIGLSQLVDNDTTTLSIFTLLKKISSNKTINKEYKGRSQLLLKQLKDHVFYNPLLYMRNNHIAHFNLVIPFDNALGNKVTYKLEDYTIEKIKNYIQVCDEVLDFICIVYEIKSKLIRDDVIRIQNVDKFKQQTNAMFEKLQV